MEGCNVKSWWKTSSSSTRLVGFIVPLMVVSAMVVLSGSTATSSNWLFTSNYYPWTWTSVYPTSSGYRSPANFSKELPPPAEDGRVGLELRRSVVGGGEREEALSADYSIKRSAAPPIGVQVREAETPVRISLIIFLIFSFFLFFL